VPHHKGVEGFLASLNPARCSFEVMPRDREEPALVVNLYVRLAALAGAPDRGLISLYPNPQPVARWRDLRVGVEDVYDLPGGGGDLPGPRVDAVIEVYTNVRRSPQTGETDTIQRDVVLLSSVVNVHALTP
jgi:hypothetical protein